MLAKISDSLLGQAVLGEQLLFRLPRASELPRSLFHAFSAVAKRIGDLERFAYCD